MEPHEYQTLFECERSHWWCRGLREVLLDILKKEGLNRASLLLDAGCGTGQNVADFSEAISEHVFAVDLSHYATPFWKKRGLRRTCLASVNHLPFSDCVFDAVVGADVLECDEVSEQLAYGELWRIVRDDGVIVLVVPAYDWLLAKEHHRAIHVSRRYTRNTLLGLLETRPITIVRLTHLFTLLFPAIAGYRLGQRLFSDGDSEQPRSELRPIPRFLNNVLYRIIGLERLLLRGHDLPFGSSLLVVARKRAQE